ncbi:uncharacterized protein UMAG_12156 [Mycosarcoma maydis]|uniref:Uncharacterized protein n=1 Tax=Mycosarcoma maydis TaxID=5270 RepID=A0A0D1C8E6_MYCMD|nr:uncharacterized protein UMAG_12156 [Ustilago maydis 521]KIS69732.1 hypothetical protein UMAG_12156 [Ustilago maydis 521]|eukprot:XP_011388908.1 hypothetical protein UMAG_12156 [Ustilago maydis 521]
MSKLDRLAKFLFGFCPPRFLVAGRNRFCQTLMLGECQKKKNNNNGEMDHECWSNDRAMQVELHNMHRKCVCSTTDVCAQRCRLPPTSPRAGFRRRCATDKTPTRTCCFKLVLAGSVVSWVISLYG